MDRGCLFIIVYIKFRLLLIYREYLHSREFKHTKRLKRNLNFKSRLALKVVKLHFILSINNLCRNVTEKFSSKLFDYYTRNLRNLHIFHKREINIPFKNFKLLNRDLSISKFHTNFETNILFKVTSFTIPHPP